MSFRFERELLAPVRRWLEARRLAVKCEFRLPWGYCDLVACELDARRVKHRVALRQTKRIGSLLRVAVLLRLPDQGTAECTDAESLVSEFDGVLSADQLARELRILEQRRFVVRTEAGGFQRLNGWHPLHREITAVELKMTRVAEAFEQAQAHLAFADKSFIALPRDAAARAAHSQWTDALSLSGVGLLAVDRSRCQVVIESLGRTSKDIPLQVHCTERFWGSI